MQKTSPPRKHNVEHYDPCHCPQLTTPSHWMSQIRSSLSRYTAYLIVTTVSFLHNTFLCTLSQTPYTINVFLSPISIPHHILPKPQPHYSNGLSTAITSSVLSYVPGLNTVDGIAHYIIPCSLHFLRLS